MSPEDFEAIRPHAWHREISSGEPLFEPSQIIETFFFPESGLISIVTANDDQIEVGVVGREGVAGLPALLGVDSGPLKAMCQLPGAGTFVEVRPFMSAASESPALSRMMLRYIHTFTVQIANTAYANAHYTVEQRLARWLLMCHDRGDGDDLLVTHEFLAMMLGVRRPGVTVATHVLEGNHLIRARRGRITILDRERLVELANDSYGLAEVEYDRVMGGPGVSTPSLILA